MTPELPNRPDIARERSQAALLLPDHPLRRRLNDEVHARPPGHVNPPARVSFLAIMADKEERGRAWSHISAVAQKYGAASPDPQADHYSADFGPYQLRAERHTEFMRIQIVAPGFGRGGAADPFAESAIDTAEAGWIAELPGKLICAINAVVAPASVWPPVLAAVSQHIASTDGLVGAMVSGGAGAAFTDLRVRDDGFSRLMLLDHAMSPGQIGRTIQRLLELDTYRMLALLAFPIARARMGELTLIEQELASVTAALVVAQDADEGAMLDRLTRLAAEIEHYQSESQFRFAAGASYYELVERRIHELREVRIEGLQTFGEFMERRLAPAMRTCRAVTERQEGLSARVARTSELLSTRVQLSSQRQSHAVLESMNRRADLQLRLQETVEGLSVAAITYYIVSLVGHAAEGLEAGGAHINPSVAMGLAIPVVALLVALGVRRIRRSVAQAAEKRDD